MVLARRNSRARREYRRLRREGAGRRGGRPARKPAALGGRASRRQRPPRTLSSTSATPGKGMAVVHRRRFAPFCPHVANGRGTGRRRPCCRSGRGATASLDRRSLASRAGVSSDGDTVTAATTTSVRVVIVWPSWSRRSMTGDALDVAMGRNGDAAGGGFHRVLEGSSVGPSVSFVEAARSGVAGDDG